ncbi:MAG TPA: tyrosine-type recombinase/integrase, partial [Blastocatellia bacterium]|nr:tyrosine-type recombinase/integrase [Blastocatellia bacterium]
MSVTAYKRNAVWWYSISDKRLPKRIRRAAPQAKLKRDAIDEGERVKRALLGGNTPDELSPNFSAFVDEVYLPYSKATKKSFKAEYGHCKALKEFFGKYQLHQIKPLLIETFKRERKASITQYKRPRSGTATNREVETLSCIMTMAVNNEMIAGNPCRKVASYKEMPRNRYMTYEEEARLMAVLDVPQRAILKAQVVMALHTGMRKSEIRKLTWGNVDFERQVLLVKG